MNRDVVLAFFVFFVIACMPSCAIAEIECEKAPAVKYHSHSTKADVSLSKEDSLRIVYLIQTNKECFLVRHIGLDNGEWVIRISRDNALTLGIAAETYDFYQSYVNNLNGQ